MSCLHGRKQKKMILKLPSSTSDLFNELDAALQKLPQRDRNMFVLDLMKFCVDWQFGYLAMKDAQNDE